MKRFPSARRASSRSRSAGPRSKRAPRALAPDVRAYIRKTDTYRAGRDPISLMKAAPAKFARAVAGLTTNQMRRRPARQKWSIAEIIGHLYDTEVVYGYRYRLSLSQPGSPIPGYDQARWVEELRHRDRAKVKRLLERIRVAREGTLDLLRQVPRRNWERYGIHAERGKETVRRTMELIAGHDLNHLDQIKAIRKKYGW